MNRNDPHTYRATVKLRKSLGDRIASMQEQSPVILTKSEIISAALDSYLPKVKAKPATPNW